MIGFTDMLGISQKLNSIGINVKYLCQNRLCRHFCDMENFNTNHLKFRFRKPLGYIILLPGNRPSSSIFVYFKSWTPEKVSKCISANIPKSKKR